MMHITFESRPALSRLCSTMEAIAATHGEQHAEEWCLEVLERDFNLFWHLTEPRLSLSVIQGGAQ